MRGPKICIWLGTGLVTAAGGLFRLSKRAKVFLAEAKVEKGFHMIRMINGRNELAEES